MNLDERQNKFDMFHHRAMEINSAKLLRSSFGSKMSAEIGKIVKFENNFPDIEYIRSLASLVRQFYNNDDSISFLHICNIICNPKNNYSTKIVENTTEARAAWKNLLQIGKDAPSPSGAVLVFDNQTFTTAKLLDLYFNSKFFHAKIDKHKLLRKAEVPGFNEQMQMNLIDVLQKMGVLILWFDKNVIEEMSVV